MNHERGNTSSADRSAVLGLGRLAVLIDADNAQASVVEKLMMEVARYGTATIKRAYGDWTTPNLQGWKDVLHRMAVQPVQQFRYTTGKNATDSALIIDAMDVLHSGGVDGFCLVSSDSDFTRLATRIREAGLVVYGFGEAKTPAPFVAACDKFIYTEILRSASEADTPSATPATPSRPKLKPMVLAALEATAREDGWATLSALGSQLNRNDPSFDPRNYECAKLGELMRKQAYVEVKEVPSPEGNGTVHLYVRRRQNVGAVPATASSAKLESTPK